MKTEKITFQCPECGGSLSVPIEAAGSTGPCPFCKEVITGPGDRGTAPSPVPPSDLPAQERPIVSDSRPSRSSLALPSYGESRERESKGTRRSRPSGRPLWADAPPESDDSSSQSTPPGNTASENTKPARDSSSSSGHPSPSKVKSRPQARRRPLRAILFGATVLLLLAVAAYCVSKIFFPAGLEGARKDQISDSTEESASRQNPILAPSPVDLPDTTASVGDPDVNSSTSMAEVAPKSDVPPIGLPTIRTPELAEVKPRVASALGDSPALAYDPTNAVSSLKLEPAERTAPLTEPSEPPKPGGPRAGGLEAAPGDLPALEIRAAVPLSVEEVPTPAEPETSLPETPQVMIAPEASTPATPATTDDAATGSQDWESLLARPIPASATGAFTALTSFLEAKTPQETLSTVTGYRVRLEDISDYYSRHDSETAFAPSGIDLADISHNDDTDEELAIFSMLYREDEKVKFFPICVRKKRGTDADWKVDWKPFVEFREGLLQQFTTGWRDNPELFHLSLTRKHFFGDGQPEGDYVSFEAKQPTSDPGVMIFAPKSGAVMKDLNARELAKWNVGFHVVAKLVWKKDVAGNEYIELLDISRHGW